MSRILIEPVSTCPCEGYEPPRRMTEQEYQWASSILAAYLFGELGIPHRLFISGDAPGAVMFLENWTPAELAQ